MNASTGFRRFGIAIAALVGAGIVALSVASYVISPDVARDAVLKEVKAATGFEAQMAGPASLSLFPSPRVALSEVALNASDQPTPPLTAGRVVAHVRWLPLLTGSFAITDLTLERPKITVSLDHSGHSNWSALIDTLVRTVHTGATAEGAQTLSFSEVRIIDGTLVVDDALHGVHETLDKIELALAWPAIAQTFAATGRVAWRRQELDLVLSVGDFPAALVGDDTGLKLRLTGPSLKLAFDGTVGYRPNTKVDGTVVADTVSLRNAMAWVAGKPLLGSGLGRFALKARTHMVGGALSLSNLNVEMDGNVAEGVLSLSTRGRPMLQGTLAVETLDLTPYGSVRLLESDAHEWSHAPLALDWFDDIDFDLRLSAARVITAQSRLGRTAVAGSLRNGRLVLTLGESRGFNGAIHGTLALTKTDNGAQLRSQLQLANVDLETCLSELFGVRRLEGKGTLSVALDGSGNSVAALTRTLSGDATFAAKQGALTGFDIEQLLRRLERRPLSAGTDFRTGRTPFDTLKVALKIAGGTASVEQIRFDGTSVKLELAGSASIPSRDLDLSGTASLVAIAEAPPPFALPFFVQGSWDDPIILPDTQALIRRSGAAAPLLEAVTDQRARSALRSALERLSAGGGDAIPLPRRPAPATSATSIPNPFDPPPEIELPTSEVPTR